MIDEILRRAMHSTPQEISSEQFHDWKRDPVTEKLFAELTIILLDSFGEELPDDLNIGSALAYKRDGAYKMVKELWNWTPVKIEQEIQDA